MYIFLSPKDGTFFYFLTRMQISSRRVRTVGQMLPKKMLGFIVHGLYLLPVIMIVFSNQVYLQVSAKSKVNYMFLH